MKNKTTLIVFWTFAAFIIIGGFFYKQIGDFAYSLPYKLMHRDFREFPVTNEDYKILKDIKNRLDNAIPRGSLEMNNNEFAFYYSSFYDENHKTYYYQFTNFGKKRFCVNSKILAQLFGKIKIAIPSNQTVYFVVNDNNPPTIYNQIFDLQENCSMFSLGGSSMDLVVPK